MPSGAALYLGAQGKQGVWLSVLSEWEQTVCISM